MAHPFGDGVQQQRPAGDGFSMPIRLGQTNEDVPPIVKQRAAAISPLLSITAKTPWRAPFSDELLLGEPEVIPRNFTVRRSRRVYRRSEGA